MSKPILCLDFDGVIHSYKSGWKGADVIPDPPVDGAIAFMLGALNHFDVVIFSSRSGQNGGIAAMQAWLRHHAGQCWNPSPDGPGLEDVRFETEKPAAFIGIDDRVLTFDGMWPTIESLKAFKPWNKREFGATGNFPQGKVYDSDEGELRLGVAYDKLNGIVRVEFGKPVAWLGLPPSEAVQLANMILANAAKALAKQP